jgi:hypothetical protein
MGRILVLIGLAEWAARKRGAPSGLDRPEQILPAQPTNSDGNHGSVVPFSVCAAARLGKADQSVA